MCLLAAEHSKEVTIAANRKNRGRMPDWRVDVEGFGRVQRASIQMAPLVVLVGRNNSGKSYIASLLWSLLNIENTVLGRRAQLTVPGWFYDFIDREESTEPLNKEQLQKWVNNTLEERKDDLARTLLSYEEASIDKLTLKLGDTVNCFFSKDPSLFDDDEEESYSVSHSIQPRGERDVEIDYALGTSVEGFPEFAGRALLIEALEAVMSGRQHFTFGATPLYIPAARTGLMLALPLIFTELLGKLGLSGDNGLARFSLPTINFLQRMVNAKGGGQAQQSLIADMLEQSLLQGAIRRDDASGPNFSYAPARGATIPLHTASSMVSELAPLMILLRSASMEAGLVFEEPESHLHLSAQRQVARAVARLVNQGIPVVLTTHSDTFVQQLNILIGLHGHPDRDALAAQFGYDTADLIDPADARGYEFVDAPSGRTLVRNVAMSDAGFIVPSLNEVLLDLSEQAISSQDY